MTDTITADLLRFAKARAKRLRAYLTDENHPISHSMALEAIAKTEGFRDWNTYAARFQLAAEAFAETPPETPETGYFPLRVGDRITGLYRGASFKGVLLGLEATINPGVWRAKLHFDTPVTLPGTDRLKHTRQRVRCMLDADGHSVNLKGRPDGAVILELPTDT